MAAWSKVMTQGTAPSPDLMAPVEAVPRPVDRRVVPGARAGDGHRQLRPAHGQAARGLPQRLGARQEGGRAADRRLAGRARHCPRAARSSRWPGTWRRSRRRSTRSRTSWTACSGAWTPGAAAGRSGHDRASRSTPSRSGDSAQITRRVTDGDIAAFVDAVGDYNPVHADREYAADHRRSRSRSRRGSGPRARLGGHRHAAARARGDLPLAGSQVPQAGEGGRLDLGPRRGPRRQPRAGTGSACAPCAPTSGRKTC